MAALYSWSKSNGQQTKKHISYGGETLCSLPIPSRHEYSVFTSGDICIRCQKTYLKNIKEDRGEDWREFIDESMVPELNID